MKQFGMLLPGWVYSWPMILIAVGLFVGARHNFRDVGWVVLVGIGGLFLMGKINPGIDIHHFIWPVVIIGVGLILLLRPHRADKWWGKHYGKPSEGGDYDFAHEPVHSGEDVIDVVSIFANIKKMILSKNFMGGETVCIFGGCEINMSQADITSVIVIDSVNLFGGTKLIVPSNWQIRSEAVAVFGGVEDKRKQPAVNDLQAEKILILKGVAMFGGIEITSY